MKVFILNGPNLNLLGQREPDIYGTQDFESYLSELQKKYPQHSIEFEQSNVEGELINSLQAADGKYDFVIFNAGGYTHTSVALADSISAIKTPVIEVHISNIFAREAFRATSLLSRYCSGIVSGFGLKSYELALLSQMEAIH